MSAIEHSGSDCTIRVGDHETGLYVEDDGPGLPTDMHERVFESGYSTASDGTGFGLAIVRRIAQAHGWTITAASGELGGARFEISETARSVASER